MPDPALVPVPLISSPRSTTAAPGALTTIPLPEVAVTPAYIPAGAMIETALSIVTGPYPAESRTMISPPAFV